MPSKQVSVREMNEMLSQLGFVRTERRGSHLLFQHPNTGVMIGLPTSERYVRLVILKSIEQSLERHGLLNKKNFRKRLGIKDHT
jgi:predicted RNA binding protein YcfA (HicA-like mRNA interferase family)